MKRFACSMVPLVFGLVVGLGRGTLAATSDNASTRVLPSMHIEQGGVYNAAAEIAQKAHLAVGVDAVQPKTEPTVIFDFPGGTVASLLNMLVSQAPDYKWEKSTDGIIRVSRIDARVALLDVPVAYPGALKKTRQRIWEDLAERPEISAWVRASGCSRSEIFTGHEFREHNAPISIKPGILTVEQLLDQVAVKSGVNYWAILQSAPTSPCRVSIIVW